MDTILTILKENPLLLLFLVAAIGYPLGRIRVAGSSVGVAAVLFVGLAFGGLDPNLKLPEFIYQLGLVVFVYTIGISNGAAFFAALGKKGLRDNLLALSVLVLALVLTFVFAKLLGLTPGIASGLFAGSLTNTPTLAAAIETLRNAGGSEQALTEPTVGYGVAYPMGVIAVLITISLLQRLWKIDYVAEARSLPKVPDGVDPIQNITIKILNEDLTSQSLESWKKQHDIDIVVGRVQRNDHIFLAHGQTQLAIGDTAMLIGTQKQLDKAIELMGAPCSDRLDLDRANLDLRRIFVSSHKVAGKKLSDLKIPERFGGIVTRVRRGDIELLPHGDTVLALGDRVRVVAPPDQIGAISKFFGDSYQELSEIDILSFSLGVVLGLALGLIPIPLPGGLTLRLGIAGGPLIVALILGALGRTGPLVWNLPYSANITLRQLGLILFLAAIGTRSGYAFVTTVFQGNGYILFLVGLVVTTSVTLATIVVGHKVLKMPMGTLVGTMAGIQTQPAVLGYALEQTKSDMPNVGYATVYPFVMLAKIILVQVLLLMLT